MNIIIFEQIFKYLKCIDEIYCCILYPKLLNIKSYKSIYLSSNNCNNFIFITKIIRYFSNFKFELLLTKLLYLDYNFNNLKNLRLTLDFYDFNCSKQKDKFSNYYKILDIPFNNISGIYSLDFHIQGYYKLKDNNLSLNKIKSVIITSENSINSINLCQVEKFVLNDGINLESFKFDNHLKSLSIFKIPNKIIQHLYSTNIEELLLNSSFFFNDIKLKDIFPNTKYLQLDFSIFCDEFKLSSLVGNFKTLSLNYIQKSFENFTNFKNLNTLHLCGNNVIKEVIGFQGRNLFLDNCCNLQNFNFQNLDSLYLQFNKNITGIDTELFKNIKTLDLSGTNIEYLSDKITNLQFFIGQECKKLEYFPKYESMQLLNLYNCFNLKKINTLNINTLNIKGCRNLINTNNIKFNHIFTY